MTEVELKEALRILYVHNQETSDVVDVPALWARVNETMDALPEADQKRIGAWVATNLPRRRSDHGERGGIEEERRAFALWLSRQFETD